MPKCDTCGKTFESREALAKHVAFHNGQLDERQDNHEKAETSLFRKAEQEHKARRRSRGPYRKASMA